MAFQGTNYPKNSFLNKLQMVLPKCSQQSSALCATFGACKDIWNELVALNE